MIKLVFPSETEATLGGESIGLCRVVNTRHKRFQIDLMRIKSQLRVILESAASNVVKACTRNDRRLTVLTISPFKTFKISFQGVQRRAARVAVTVSEGKVQIPQCGGTPVHTLRSCSIYPVNDIRLCGVTAYIQDIVNID